MNFKEILSNAFPIIEKSAPILASALGSPAAGIGASWAVSLLANAFGIHPNEIEKLSDVINNDPCAGQKITDIENNFKSLCPHHLHIIPPEEAEINIKLKWNYSKIS